MVQIQLIPDTESARKLRESVERFNEAANWLAGVAFDQQISNKIGLQKIAYREVRERFGLSSQMACLHPPGLRGLQAGQEQEAQVPQSLRDVPRHPDHEL